MLVDGDLSVTNGGELHVVNPGNNTLEIYLAGDFTAKNGQAYVGSTGSVDSKHLLVFGRSDTQVGLAGGSTYVEAAVFAPRNEQVAGINTAFPTAQSQCDLGGYYADTCIATGNSALDGALVAGPAAVKQSTNVNYDPDLAGIEFAVNANELLPPPLTYLHLSINPVAIDGGTSVGPTVTPSATPTATPPGTPTATPPGTSTPTSTPPPNGAPTADFTMNRNGNSPNLELDAGPSSDADGTVVSYEWDVGDDGTVDYTGETIEEKISSGTPVTLVVTDDDGATASSTKTAA
jgi:hypothetical protein